MPKIGLRSLFPYLRDHRTSLVVVAVLSLITTAGTLAQPLLTRDVLDGIGAGTAIGAAVAALVTVLVAVAVLDGFRSYLLKRTAEGLVLTARRHLAGRLLRLPIAEYDARRTGDLLSRVGADTTLLRAVVTSGLFDTVSGGLMVIGAAAGMILLDAVLFGVTLAGLSIGLTGGIIFVRRIRGLSRQAQERIGEMTSAVERAISAARTIRASRAEARETETVSAAATHAYRAGLRIAKLESAISPAMSITVQGSFLLVLGVGGARVASGAITIGDLVAFVLFIFFLVMPLGQAMNAYTQLQAGLGALSRMEEVMAIPAEGAAPSPAHTASQPASLSAATRSPAASVPAPRSSAESVPAALSPAASQPGSLPLADLPADLSPADLSPAAAAADGAAPGHTPAADPVAEPMPAHAPVDGRPVLAATADGTPALLSRSATGNAEATAESAARHEPRLVIPPAAAAGEALAQTGLPTSAEVSFDSVGFAYATGATILKEVTFTVPPGTRTALVGPSGAGKSTLLALVERFYEVSEGAVRIGGVDIRQMTHDQLRSRLGYVEQESPVLAGTLRENLLLATPSATEEQLYEVLRAVNLSDVVDRTPLGLDAQVGEGGVLLSGGERQRLAIARTLLAAPDILLLDEPTSNLDARNEAALKSAIDTAATGRTVLIVAHRLSTVVDADQIVVLEHGRVVARGSHDELLATSPLYRELASHQFIADTSDAQIGRARHRDHSA